MALNLVWVGFILVGFVGKGSVTLGQDLALNSLAAAILGGVNFGNGKGGMAGPAVAAFMLTFLFNFLTSLGLGEPGRLMLQGAIIAGAALVFGEKVLGWMATIACSAMRRRTRQGAQMMPWVASCFQMRR